MLAFLVTSTNAQTKLLPPEFGWYEAFAGAEATTDAWLVYGGVTAAPFSKDIYSDGIRLRVVSGYGQYSYQGERFIATLSRDPQIVKFHAETEFVDALVGYQMRFDALTAKVFVGVSAINHAIAPTDCFDHRVRDSHPTRYVPQCNPAGGFDFGFKGAIELWLNLDENSWMSLNLSYTTAHDTSAASFRQGYRILPSLSLGPELRYNRNSGSSRLDHEPEDSIPFQYNARAGGFMRYEWLNGEASLAAGVATSMTELSHDRLEPYVSFSTALKF